MDKDGVVLIMTFMEQLEANIQEVQFAIGLRELAKAVVPIN